MYYRSPYRFARVLLPVFLILTIFSAATVTVKAQDEYPDSTAPVVEAPDEEYDEESSESNTYQYEETPPELRAVSDSTVGKLKREKDFEYANDPAYLVKEKPEPVKSDGFWNSFNKFFSGGMVRTIAYMLLIAFFIFVIYRIIVVNKLFLFYPGKKSRVYDEESEEALSPQDIDEKIRKAIAENDYRSAIRFLYLKGLNLLSDRGWIRLHAQATNHDYVFQLRDKPIAGDFRFLTKVYDYVWYGEFAVNEEQFNQLHNDFQRFHNTVRR